MVDFYVTERPIELAVVARRKGLYSLDNMLEENWGLEERFPDGMIAADHMLLIPDPRPAEFECAVNASHTFVRRTLTIDIGLQLLDEEDEPYAGQEFVIACGEDETYAATDEHGWLEATIPAPLEDVIVIRSLPPEMELEDDEAADEVVFEVNLAPRLGDSEPDLKRRLHNLGYDFGDELDRDEWNERSHAALLAFLADEGDWEGSLDELVKSMGPRDLRDLLLRRIRARYDDLLGS